MDSETHYTTLYESRAHIFQINPETKTSWLPMDETAIPIAFVASILDQHHQQQEVAAGIQCRRQLKIIGTNDAGENVLDATIMPKTTFTKRSQKFGQWTDHTGTVYGLGFNSEADLTEFVETFQQLQREILSQPTSQPASQSAILNHDTAGSQQQNDLLHQHQLQSQRAPLTGANRDKSAYYQQQDPGSRNDNKNNFSEMNDGRYNPSSGRASTVSSTGTHFSSNTLAHPGHQMKRQPVQRPVLANGGGGGGGGDTSLNNTSTTTNGNNNGATGMSAAYPRSQSMFGLQSGRTSHNNSAGKSTPDEENSPVSQNDWQIRDQLKYENERLKQALEESSKNAVVWHTELLNLRTNNVKLTQALQESKAHVQQWERELYSLRDENKELHLRLKALESVGDPEKASDYKKEVQKYKSYMEEVQGELRKKENEIEELQRSMEELELKRTPNSNGGQTHDESPISSQKLHHINAKLEAKVNELVNVSREFSQLLDKS